MCDSVVQPNDGDPLGSHEEEVPTLTLTLTLSLTLTLTSL